MGAVGITSEFSQVAAHTPSRVEAAAANEPPAPSAAASPAVVNVTAGNPQWDGVANLAFAVKVETARIQPAFWRASAADQRATQGTTPRQTPAGKAAPAESAASSPSDGSKAGSSARQSADHDRDGESADSSAVKAGIAAKKIGANENPAQDQPAPRLMEPAPANAVPPLSTASESRSIVSQSASAPLRTEIPNPPDRLEPPSPPLRDVSVRVENAEGRQVDVRIVQRAGDMQIAVRSVDSDTTQGLRHGLSELATRLNDSGYRSETWHPGQAAASPQPGESGNQSHRQNSGESQSNSSGSQQNRGQRDNNPPNRPRWIQELESKLAGGSQSKGESHGLIS
jgi:hypothetical protein